MKKSAITIQMKPGEVDRIHEAVARVALASKNKFLRCAVHLGMRALGSVSPAEAAKMIAEFDALPDEVKFGDGTS